MMEQVISSIQPLLALVMGASQAIWVVLGLLVLMLPVDTLAFIGLNQDIDVFINYGDGTRLRYRVYLNDSQDCLAIQIFHPSMEAAVCR